MIEKIKISLWDLFAFFLSGLLAFAFAIGHLLAFEIISLETIKATLFQLPASFSLFVIPTAFTVAGLLLEPLANYFNKVFDYGVEELFGRKLFLEKKKHQKEEAFLAKIIRQKYLGDMSLGITNPYHLCKEYVETKQLSTTFMVFLSRFGFYRNVSFLCVVGAIIAFWHFESWKAYVPSILAWIFLAGVFKRRSEDFYGYLAPNVYRCFLIDRAFGDGAIKHNKVK